MDILLVVVAQSGSCCWLCQPCRFLEPGNWPTTTGGKESRLNPIDPRCSVLSNTFRLFFSFFVCLPPFFPPSPVFFFVFLAEWSSVLVNGAECGRRPLPRSAHSKWNYAWGYPDAVCPSSCQTSRPPTTHESVGTAPANKSNAETLRFVLKTRQPIH